MIIQFDQYLVDEVDIISMNNESIKIYNLGKGRS